MGTGEKEETMIPDDAVDASTMIEELEGYVSYYDDVVDMLQSRLRELDGNECICGKCLDQYREETGTLKQ